MSKLDLFCFLGKRKRKRLRANKDRSCISRSLRWDLACPQCREPIVNFDEYITLNAETVFNFAQRNQLERLVDRLEMIDSFTPELRTTALREAARVTALPLVQRLLATHGPTFTDDERHEAVIGSVMGALLPSGPDVVVQEDIIRDILPRGLVTEIDRGEMVRFAVTLRKPRFVRLFLESGPVPEYCRPRALETLRRSAVLRPPRDGDHSVREIEAILQPRRSGLLIGGGLTALSLLGCAAFSYFRSKNALHQKH